MRVAFWLLAVLPAAAQPKLLINTQVDTRSAATGLERQFRSLLTAGSGTPAWIGYSVPSVRSFNLGCEYVSPGGRTVPGVVHLEPPQEAIILFRVVGGAVDRVRALSPDCEIDAGGVPVHWLTDVRPAESVVLLGAIDLPEAVMAIAMHADTSADAALERMMGSSQPDAVRRRAVFWMGAARGSRGLEALKQLLATESDSAMRERAISGVAASSAPEAVDLLIATARQDKDVRVRRQAMNAIGRSRDPRARAFLEDVLKK